MPQDRNFEGGGRNTHHDSLGRRVREFGVVIALAPTMLGSGLPAVSGLQEQFMKPNAITWVSSVNMVNADSLLGERAIHAGSSCGGEPVIIPPRFDNDAELNSYPNVTDVKFFNESINASGSFNGEKGTFISTDGGNSYTFLKGVTILLNGGDVGSDVNSWSPTGKLFVGSTPDDEFALFHTTDGCSWKIVAQASSGSMDNTKWYPKQGGLLQWSEDGQTVTIELTRDNRNDPTGADAEVSLSSNGEISFQEYNGFLRTILSIIGDIAVVVVVVGVWVIPIMLLSNSENSGGKSSFK